MSGAIVMKAVLPKLLKQDAIRLALLNPMRKTGTDIRQDFDKTTRTWEDKPRFTITRNLNSREGFLRVWVWTEHQHFIWVNEGTRAHYVPKFGKATMAFRKYKAKTRVRVIESGAGGRFGPTIVRTGRWKVSGIKAREFDKVLKKKWQPQFEDRMIKAMAEARMSSGHAI